MIRIFFIALFLFCSLDATTKTIDKKIEKNKKILNTNSYKKRQATIRVKELANQIKQQNKDIIKLEKDIKRVNIDIEKHQQLLEKAKIKLEILKGKSSKLIQEKKVKEEDIVDTIIEDFSTSIALKLASKASLQELIDNEIYTLLSQNTKTKIQKLNNNYDKLTSNTKIKQKSIKKISSYIKKRQRTKQKLKIMKEKHSKSLVNLENQHKSYQKELKKVVQQQESLKQLLSRLHIIKKEEIEKARRKAEAKKRKLQALKEKRKKLLAKKNKQKDKTNEDKKEDIVKTAEIRNQEYASNLNLDVRKIGSSTAGIKIVRYKGRKTIAPLKSFKVAKKFGTYYDPIYKIKLFNESVVLKSKQKKAKVLCILNGKVVFAKKDTGMLENVVIIQHKNGLHTIYSHLDEIAPTLKVGKWIKKGYVVGRVNQSLMFQATKDSAHINPRDLFRM